MKKLLILALLISYGISSFGVSLNYFYCCGKLKSITLEAKTNPQCFPKKKKGCCENKKVTLKLTIDQKSEQSKKILLNGPEAFTAYKTCSSVEPTSIPVNCFPGYSYLKPLLLQKKNILFCVFRI